MPRRFRIPSLFIALLACAALAHSVARAAVPPIMSYSGELQSAGGAPLASGRYTMTFSLYTAVSGSAPIWTEVHSGVEVAGGRFQVQLGATQSVALMALPFDRPYFIGVSVGSDPEMSPRQQLVTLPYAFRAGLADQVANGAISTEKIAPLAVTDEKIESLSWSKITDAPVIDGVVDQRQSGGSSGVPANVWSLKGNRNSNPLTDFLGTTDARALVIKVNSQTLMNLAVGGPITATTGFEMTGDLGVGGNTSLRGRLDVTGATTLQSTLGVNGVATFGNTSEATSSTTGGLITSGGVGIAKNLFVEGNASFANGITAKALNVTDANTGYLATLVNTDATTGDGLVIKLGKTHPTLEGTNPDDYYEAIDYPAEVIEATGLPAKFLDWINQTAVGNPPLPTTVRNAIRQAGQDVFQSVACEVANYVIGQINEAVMPVTIGPINLPSGICAVIPGWPAPCQVIPQVEVIRAIPNICTPTLDLSNVLAIPSLTLSDVPNSLGHANEYISFKDKDDRRLGAIRAESVQDWKSRYLSINYFLNLAANALGLDAVKDVFGIVASFSNLTEAYNAIGVEYMSGHGDYAEWLERLDHDERVSAGDIVAVKGGKITRNMDGAEQVMAVSRRPIMLGNMPPAHLEAMGNNVAFLGQVPVKVQGAVSVGDYIVARSDIPGYGIAVKPADMTPDDFRLCVGRSWETQERGGPKLVNTVVGIQNGDFVRILKKTIDANQALEGRMLALEERMDRVTGSGAATATFKTASAGR